MKLTSTSDMTRAARQIETSAALLGATVSAALRSIADQTGGYPSSASGSNSGGSNGLAIAADQHGPSEHIAATAVELQAINSAPDVAARDRDRLASLLGRIYDDLHDAARICGNYTAGRPLTTADVIAAHAAATDGLWCSNCETHGHLSPRKNGKHCGWCYSFHATHGVWPPKQLTDLHAQGRRITDRVVASALDARKRKPAMA